MTKGVLTNGNKPVWQLRSPIGGISDTKKSGPPDSAAFLLNMDVRTDPSQATVDPAPTRVGGGVITDLIMWWDLACDNLYGYGNTGNIYKKTSADVWSLDHIAPDSQGNGLVYFPEDGYLYYARNTSIGRQIDARTGGTYYDSFIESEGGAPTNTQSITFVRASSQYASIADNAALSITNDITMEAYLKLSSLPATNGIFTIASKWNENSNQRAYKFDITTSSNFFGDGSDGSLTISSNTTQAPIDSACSVAMGSTTMTATNASFVAGQNILIVQMKGTNAGQAQRNKISSYSTGTIVLQDPANVDFASNSTDKAQVIVIPQYINVTINSGMTWTAKAWNGTVGGVLLFCYNGTLTRNGNISANACGFRGGRPGNVFGNNSIGEQGENPSGSQSQSNSQNNGGGGGGSVRDNNEQGNGGGGGGYGSTGSIGIFALYPAYQNGGRGAGGSTIGSSDLSTLFMGPGGGGGGYGDSGGVTSSDGKGGIGGGILWIAGPTFPTGSGTVSSAGGGSSAKAGDQGPGGGGAAGSILIYTQVANAEDLSSLGGAGANGGEGGQSATGNGGDGRIAVYYSSTTAGTANPTQSSIVDSTLSNVSGYALRLLLSSNGTNSETHSMDITSLISSAGLIVSQWKRFQVKWRASTATASFYVNGALLGSTTQTFTSIFDSTARFALAASYDSSGTAVNFLDAKMDDFRIWNDLRTDTELVTYNDQIMVGVEQGFIAYYKFEGNVNDSQTVVAANNLTATNTPTYSTDVPFSGVTTRADQDVLINAAGNTYALGTTLNEGATHRQSFVPTKEPLKSISLNINTVGTGNWTVVVHDGLNRLQNSLTVVNAALHTGIYEFIFATPDRPILGATYHVHVYSTVADGIIVSSTNNDMEGTTANTGAYLGTFFQVLVDDPYHPMVQFLTFVAVGNERYVATIEPGVTYNPHRIVLPAGYRVRSLAFWGEYLAIGTWKGTTITDTDSGKIFFWNGTDDTFAEGLDVPEGGINSMYGTQGTLSVVAGYEGKFLQYTGGPKAYKTTQVPLQESIDYVEIAPGSMTMWRSLIRFGGSLNTNSTTLHQGIYAYGKLNENVQNNALGFDALSIGDQTSSSVKVGGVFPAGRKLYVGWQNGNVFGADLYDPDSDPYTTARIENLITNLDKFTAEKMPLVYRIDCEALVSGQSITLQYQADRSGTWNTLITQSSVGTNNVRGIINQRAKEIQTAMILTTNGATPVILNQVLEYDPYDPVI